MDKNLDINSMIKKYKLEENYKYPFDLFWYVKGFEDAQNSCRKLIEEKIDKYRDITQYKVSYEDASVIHKVCLELKKELIK